MLSGNPYLRSYNASSRAQEAINFVCLGAAGGSTYGSGLPTTDCPDGLRLQVIFPSCWDGQSLDSVDHKSHVAFPTGISTGSCDDPRFPVRLVTIFYEVFYDSTDFKDIWYGNSQPFVLANGDPTGYGFHGDFMNGWNVTVLQNAIDTCTDLSGDMDICEAFTVQHPASSDLQCHKSPSVEEVVVNAVLPTLPGCNPITAGPGTASAATCPNLIIPTLWTNTTGYYGNIVPPGYHSLSTSSIVQTYKNWNYLGCFADTSARVLQQRFTSGVMTIESCLDTCQSNGYTYGGVEWAQECWCGHSLNAVPLSFQQCSMTCSGNSSEYCGAGLALTTYELSGVPAVDSSIVPSLLPAPTTTTKLSSTSSTSVATSTGPVIAQTVGVYNFSGCYLDSSNRVLTQRITSGDGSTESCAASCRQLGLAYFGIEYGGQCYGGTTLTSSVLKPELCNMPCTSNAKELCGGSWGLQVYHTDAAPPVYNFNWSPVGCYTDSYSRTLRYQVTANATVESCLASCQSQGYQYAGLESWTECYCDSAIQSTGSVAPSTDCNLPCDHNHAEMCGGSWRLSVYYGVQSVSSSTTGSQVNSAAARVAAIGVSTSPTLTTTSLSSLSTLSSGTPTTPTASKSSMTTTTLAHLSYSSSSTISTSSSSRFTSTLVKTTSSKSLAVSTTNSQNTLSIMSSSLTSSISSSSSKITTKRSPISTASKAPAALTSNLQSSSRRAALIKPTSSVIH